nr:hypothetical protein [Tanacetum cinerariifolium]
MDSKKNIVDLETFRDMLHISPKVPGQSFDELPFEEEILDFLWNTKAYKEYYACATGEAAPKPKASATRKKSDSDTSITPPTAIPTPITTVATAPKLTAATKGKQPVKEKSLSNPSEVERKEAEQLKIVLRRSRQETHISQRSGSSTDEGTDDDDDDDKDDAERDDDDDDDDDEEEIAKIDEQEDTESGGGDEEENENDEESDDEETREEESFDPISRTPKDSEDDVNGEKDQGLRISEEERIHEEEEADELYRDVNINQGRGLQLSQDIEGSHVTLTLVHPDGQQESSSTTQQYGAILPIELTTDEIRNSKAYKEYYACATGEAAPKQKASARKKKGDSASSTTPPTLTPTTTVMSALRLSATAKGKQPARATIPTKPTDVQRTKAEQLKIVLKRSRQETHISQQRSSDTDEGTDVGGQEEGDKSDKSDDERDEGSDDDSDETVKAGAGKDDDDNDDEDDDDNDEEEELAKDDEEDAETGKGGDEVSETEGKSKEEEETRQEEEESFNPIPRTPRESEEESNDEDDQDLRLSKEARIQEEEDADELYRDVNINQGRGLQVTQNVEDTHVTLTPVNPDGPQESSSVSSFVTIMLNPTSDVGVESIFTTASSSIVSLQTTTPIMTPSTIATITTSGDAPIPSTTIPSIILENLPTFNLAFRFDERLRSLETSFSEYRQTNPFVDATDRLQDSLQQENDEFLCNIDENIKKIIKGQVKNQVKEQVSRILPRIKKSVNATLEAEVLTRSSHSSRTSYAIAADLSEMELKKILIEKMEENKSIQRLDEQRNLYKELVEAYDADKAILDTYGDSTILKRRREDDDQEGPSTGSDRGSKRQKEGGEHASASTPSKKATKSAGRSTKGSQSR